jgi:hypothetical protein
MIDINSYSNISIPVIGYVFIGITTLALTYVTLADNSSGSSSETSSSSAVSMLPSLTSTTEVKTGGKKHKKTINHLRKSKNPKNKTINKK